MIHGGGGLLVCEGWEAVTKNTDPSPCMAQKTLLFLCERLAIL